MKKWNKNAMKKGNLCAYDLNGLFACLARWIISLYIIPILFDDVSMELNVAQLIAFPNCKQFKQIKFNLSKLMCI